MNCEEIKKNFVEYWRGAMNAADLHSFEEHLAACPDCRADAERLKHVWSALGEMPHAEPGLGLRTRFYASLREAERRELDRRQRSWWMPHPALQAAFGVIILAAGILVGNMTARNSGQVAQLRTEVNSMKQLVTLSLLQQQNASDRLRGVNWSYRVEQSDSEVLAALLATVNHDPNVNVRLAAVDALRNFGDSAVGRRGLAQALNKQTSPLVEIAILDQIVEMREKMATPAIRTLMATGDVNPEVKEHANWALRQLQMKRAFASAPWAAMVAVLWLPCVADEPETIRKTFTGVKSVEVDNVSGSIHVAGYDGAEAQVEARKTVTADDAERAAAAQREVKLDMTQDAGAVRLYVDGPFRCDCGDTSFRSRNNSRNDMREHGRRGYKVAYDFDIKVPRATALYLATVNDGEIRVEGTSGDFDVENINGGVKMDGIAGSGRAYALNGAVEISFARNPERSSYFGSLNGVVEAWFQPNLSADARVKTFNGGVYTDFPVSYLPAVASAGERRNGKFVYRSNDFQGIRIGGGGPEYKFENFNGDIRIRNRGQK